VLGGPVTHDCHFRFKLNHDCKDSLTITFELLNAQNQVEKELRTQVMIFSPNVGISDWIDKERGLMNPLDEMPKITLCPRN
jgi:hypothetical protein